MKKKLKKLRLQKETVSRLDRNLGFVVGGTATYEHISGCGICSNGGCGGGGTGGCGGGTETCGGCGGGGGGGTSAVPCYFEENG